MKTIISSTKNIGKKDLINASNSRPLKEMAGKSIVVTGCATMEDTDKETGEVKSVCYFKTNSGECFTSISDTIGESMDMLIDFINEEGEQTIDIHMNKSNSGRDFLTMTIQ